MGKPSKYAKYDIQSDFGRLSRASTRKIKGVKVEWVYFIQSLAEPFRIKIGKTQNLRMRLMGIQWMCPVPLAFLGAHIWPEHTEPAIHECFAEFRSHGEWFYPDDRLVAAIEALNGPDIPSDPMGILELFKPFSAPTIDPAVVWEKVYSSRAKRQTERRVAMEDDYFDELVGWKPKGSVKYSRDFEVPR